MYKNSVELAGGRVRVVGTTLWSEGDPTHKEDVESHLADYNQYIFSSFSLTNLVTRRFMAAFACKVKIEFE